MTTITNTFNRYLASVNTSTVTGVLGAAVAAGTDVIVTGLIVCNTHATQAVKVDIKIDRSGTTFYLIK